MPNPRKIWLLERQLRAAESQLNEELYEACFNDLFGTPMWIPLDHVTYLKERYSIGMPAGLQRTTSPDDIKLKVFEGPEFGCVNGEVVKMFKVQLQYVDEDPASKHYDPAPYSG